MIASILYFICQLALSILTADIIIYLVYMYWLKFTPHQYSIFTGKVLANGYAEKQIIFMTDRKWKSYCEKRYGKGCFK